VVRIARGGDHGGHLAEIDPVDAAGVDRAGIRRHDPAPQRFHIDAVAEPFAALYRRLSPEHVTQQARTGPGTATNP
jgi:hypothetical protein